MDITLPIELKIYIGILAGIIAACLTSFINCQVGRRVDKKSVDDARSRCDGCGHTLNAVDLIPVLGYAIRRGKCKYCGQKIPVVNPISELISGICAGLLAGYTSGTPQFIMWMIAAVLLLAVSLIDIKTFIIPNTLLLLFAANRIIWVFVQREDAWEFIKGSLFAAIIPALLLAFVLVYEKLKKREAMGGGDIKLLLATALYLTPAQEAVTLLCACFMGIAAGKAKMDAVIPFGPWLAVGTVLSVTVLKPLAEYYTNLM